MVNLASLIALMKKQQKFQNLITTIVRVTSTIHIQWLFQQTAKTAQAAEYSPRLLTFTGS